MANSLSGKLKGGKYKQKLHFVPCADKEEPQVGHEISEAAIFRFLLNEETMGKFDEAAEVEIAKMLDVLKDIDKQSKITQVEIHQSSMHSTTDIIKAYHAFIVFKSTSETADDGVQWWSLEKSTDYIFLQRSRNKENVKDKFKGEVRTRVKLIKEDLKGKGTIKDLFEILWAQQLIPENYHIKKSNCQSLVSFVGQQITNIGYKYKGKFKYYPPPEKGRDKKMLELINVITGCSDDWSPLFHLIKMGSTDLVDKTVASGMYDINASCKEMTPLHLAIRLKKTKMVKHLLQHPLNADPTKRDASGKSALLFACSVANGFEMKEEIIDLLLAHDKVNVDDVDGKGRTALHLAARETNVVAFKKLLENGANPKILDKKGQSPLHLAAHSRFGDPIIDLLLAHDQVKVDDVDGNGQTALHLAAHRRNISHFQKLLYKGANPNIFDKKGQSPLHLAAEGDFHCNIIDLLLAHGKVMIDHADENGETALHLAAHNSNIGAVQNLLDKGANPNIFDKEGMSPLHMAAKRGINGNEIMDLLLAHHKVNVDDVDKDGRTALHLAAAAFLSNVIAVQKLLEKGADTNIFDKWGQSSLHRAVERNNNKIIDLLLAHVKVMIVHADENVRTALHLAVSKSNAIAVQKLLDHADENGRTALHLAVSKSNAIAVQKLLEKGANPNIFDKWGRSPLYIAVLSEKSDGNEIMDLLLAHDKVNVDDVNAYGDTALHGAALTSNVIAVQKLLEKGANPKITNKWGQSPLHMAAKTETNGNEHWALWAARQRRGQRDGVEIMDLLLAHSKVKVDDVDGKGQTALHIATYESNVMAVKYLINKGADPNAVDQSGDSPLLVAVRQRDGNTIIDLLLEAQKVKGIGDVNNANKQGRTALHYAAAYSDVITAEHLIKKGANVNCRANVGLTPLHYAVLGEKKMKIIDLLLENIIEGDIQQYRNDERLFLFARHNLHGLGNKILDRLVERGIKLPCGTETDDCITAESDEATGVNTRRFVLDKGADPSIDLTGFDGLDFLIARVKKSLEIDEILKEEEFDINGRNQDGLTLLLVAIRVNYANAVRRLLEKGADPTIRNNKGETPFHVAVIKDRDFDILNLLLESGKVDINEKTEYGVTALYMAVMDSNTATAGFLLSKGANPNVADENESTPLHLAVKYAKDMDIVELLVNHKDTNVNLLNYKGHSALDRAKKNIHRLGERIANLLREKGAVERENGLFKRNKKSLLKKLVDYTSSYAEDEIEKVLSDAKVPIEDQIARIINEHLISAIQDSDVESIRLLLKNGADIRTLGNHGMNALHWAATFAKTTDVIDALLETGTFDINGVDNNGWTPLHWAISPRYTNCEINARHLIRKGADPTIANKEGDTPLHYAARYGKIETISLILENEQVDGPGDNGRTTLHHAIEARRPNTARYLLKKGADPNAVDEDGITPLHLAAKEDCDETTELIDIIFETGKCNINGVDNYGRTPLHYAIERYAAVTINARHLIEMGADPGIADKNGVTPLHMAARNADAKSMDLIDELLLKVKTGAVDVNSVDNQGRTPLACARNNKYGPRQRIIDRLKEYGAKE